MKPLTPHPKSREVPEDSEQESVDLELVREAARTKAIG